jgi:hypothetical protein
MSDYLFDKEGEEDPEVAQLEQLLGGHGHRAPLRPPAPRRRRWATAAAASAVLAAAAIVAIMLVGSDPDPTPAAGCGPDGPGFAFASEGGAVRCGGATAGSGVLPIGEWLETSAEGSAQVEVADIGDLLVHGGSRVRLVGTGPDEHRLELARGRVSAQVLAPPRLFVIDTPGASAVDLGCAYELAVDAEGRTHLEVTTGAVSLEGNGLVAYVAAGTEVFAVPGRGPGTPIVVDAAKPLRDAAARYDAGDSTALDELLALAQERDAITLWNLLGRTDGEARGAVHRRLDAIHKRPASVREQDILDGQPAALASWRESIEGEWFE